MNHHVAKIGLAAGVALGAVAAPEAYDHFTNDAPAIEAPDSLDAIGDPSLDISDASRISEVNEAITNTFEGDFFVADYTCTFRESKEEMRDWLTATTEKLGDEGHEGNGLLAELSAEWRSEFYSFAEAQPERAANYLRGIETYQTEVANVMTEAGEWDLSNEENTLATFANWLTRTRIDTLEADYETRNTMCDPVTGEVISTGGPKNVRANMLTILFNANAKNIGTENETLNIADRKDEDKIYSVRTGGSGLAITPEGDVLVAVVACGNLQYETEFVPPTTTTTTETTTPDGSTTTHPTTPTTNTTSTTAPDKVGNTPGTTPPENVEPPSGEQVDDEEKQVPTTSTTAPPPTSTTTRPPATTTTTTTRPVNDGGGEGEGGAGECTECSGNGGGGIAG